MAAGGMGAWRSIDRARHTVTTVWYDSTGSIRRERPRRVTLRKTSRGEESRIERPEPECVGGDVFYGFGLPFKLRDPGVNLEGRRLSGEGVEVRVSFGSRVGAHPGDR